MAVYFVFFIIIVAIIAMNVSISFMRTAAAETNERHDVTVEVDFETFKREQAYLIASYIGSVAYMAKRVSQVVEPEESAKYYLIYRNDDVVASFAVRENDKYIFAVVKNNKFQDCFRGFNILSEAKRFSGRWLDCYSELEKFYSNCGFVVVRYGDNIDEDPDSLKNNGAEYYIMMLKEDAVKFNGAARESMSVDEDSWATISDFYK